MDLRDGSWILCLESMMRGGVLVFVWNQCVRLMLLKTVFHPVRVGTYGQPLDSMAVDDLVPVGDDGGYLPCATLEKQPRQEEAFRQSFPERDYRRIWTTELGKKFHIDPDCAGSENAIGTFSRTPCFKCCIDKNWTARNSQVTTIRSTSKEGKSYE